ncbi:MAG TPA: quinone-dependent dihydroorotate dehydrogenase [Candidatus Saccharimonadales bacterium]
MYKPVSAASGTVYKHVAKPILFKMKPDTVHHRMLGSAIRLQKSKFIKGTLDKSWAYHNPAMLGQTLHGITFDNPIGLSAGLDANFELAPMLKAIGFGLMEGGSLTYQPCEGNPRPWFYRVPSAKSLVVNKGLANRGVDAIMEHIKSYPKDTFKDFRLNISVAKTNSPVACTEDEAVADYLGSLKAIKKAKVGDMITINLSCPNTYAGEPFTTPKRLEHLLREVDKLKLEQPLFIKMPSHLEWKEFDGLLKVIIKHRVTGVTISNLGKNREPLEKSGVLPTHIPGKLSGKPTYETSNMLIASTYRRYGDKLTIIGVGGVFSAEDAYTKIKLGASLVELITGMIFEGPQLIGQINRGLVDLLKKDGLANISQAIGMDNKRP